MKQKLHIDIETYSSVSLESDGAYKYFESIDFEILLVAYAFDDGPISIIDLAEGEKMHTKFIEALRDNSIRKCAHNAAFERGAFRTIGFDVPIDQWDCSMIKAAYCGLPLSLGGVSEVLGLAEKGKLYGKDLIRYFCIPAKVSKVDMLFSQARNFPEDSPVKWNLFKEYCKQDVEAERKVFDELEGYDITFFERQNYILDQEINDRGVRIDTEMATQAILMDELFSKKISDRIIELTQIKNPNSPAQLKKWLSSAMGKSITTLAKDAIMPLIEEAGPGAVSEVLKLRQKLSKSSIKKYTTMIDCACQDDRAHGLFQFYGTRTGRWAGRLIQPQNLARNYLEDLKGTRNDVRTGNYELVEMLYEDVSSVLSQLIRTALIPKDGSAFAVADFSSIEARVIAWFAGEKWRMEVFNSHGKIYETSAAKMFSIPIEKVTKESDYRAKGKIAELALGFGGSVGALTSMGGESMGLSETEMKAIVKKWREANKKIVSLWKSVDKYAKQAIKTKSCIIDPDHQNLEFTYDGSSLTIKLPSGRLLFYREPSFIRGKFGQEAIQFKGVDPETKQWVNIETYGGKLVENIIQATARDILAYSMLQLAEERFKIVMHVHDEVICEVPIKSANKKLAEMCSIMSHKIPWAKGLPLTADGYVTPFYKKD